MCRSDIVNGSTFFSLGDADGDSLAGSEADAEGELADGDDPESLFLLPHAASTSDKDMSSVKRRTRFLFTA
jgi:hypothetical protein